MIIGEMKDTKSELAKQLLGTAWAIRSICYYNLLIRFLRAAIIRSRLKINSDSL